MSKAFDIIIENTILSAEGRPLVATTINCERLEALSMQGRIALFSLEEEGALRFDFIISDAVQMWSDPSSLLSTISFMRRATQFLMTIENRLAPTGVFLVELSTSYLTSGDWRQFRESLLDCRLDVSIIQEEECIYLIMSPPRGEDKILELVLNGKVVSSFSDTFMGRKDGRLIKSMDECWSYLPSDYELLGDVKHFMMVRVKDHLLSVKGKTVPVFLLNSRMDELKYERRREVLEGESDMFCIIGDGFNVTLDCERSLIRVLYKLNAYRSVEEKDAFRFVLGQWIPYTRYDCPVWQDISNPLQAESILEKYFREIEGDEQKNWNDLKNNKEKYSSRYRSDSAFFSQDFPSLSKAKTSEPILLEGWSAKDAGPRRQRYLHVLLYYLNIKRKDKKVIQKRISRANKRRPLENAGSR